MKIRLTLCLMVLLGITGCANTSGRFALVDIDLRNPDQILSGEHEVLKAEDISTSDIEPAAVEARSLFSRILVDIISVFKGRFRIFTVEWTE